MEEDFIDKFGNLIKFDDKQWSHILDEHPEIEPYKNRLLEVLSKPNLVKISKKNKDIFLYYRFYKDIYKGKYLLVVARANDNPMLLTCYITDRIKEGGIKWKKD